MSASSLFMASLFKDPKSPFWFLRYKDPATGKWRQKSTGLRRGVGTERRKAEALLAEHDLRESRHSPRRDSWKSWVPEFFKTRYADKPRSLDQSQKAWRVLERYLESIEARAPQDLDYARCRAFMEWRTAQTVAGRPINHNTARLELVYLGVVCGEAVRRGVIASNPAARLGVGRRKPPEKPEFTDAHIKIIRAELEGEPPWLRGAFEIALHQGCRFAETDVFATDVDLARGLIHHRKTKGDKPFTAPVHPDLLPLLKRLVAQARNGGRERLLGMPPGAGRQCHRFFKKLRDRVPGATFHCTRVTVASRLARGDVAISKSMRLLNHSSELVHRVYQRLLPADVADVFSAVNIPSSESPGSP